MPQLVSCMPSKPVSGGSAIDPAGVTGGAGTGGGQEGEHNQSATGSAEEGQQNGLCAVAASEAGKGGRATVRTTA